MIIDFENEDACSYCEDSRGVGRCDNCGLEYYNFELRGGLCQDCREMELMGDEYGSE